MKEIAITTTSFGECDNAPLALCKKSGLKVILNPYKRKIKPEELICLAKEAIGIIAGTEAITEDVLLRLPRLKVISRCGVGMDNVDLAAAKKLGIKVFNTPDAPTSAVAELTVGLILDMLRKISRGDVIIRSGAWEKYMGNLLNEKRVGIIGFGRIGKRLAGLLKAFNCQVAFFDPFIKDCPAAFKKASLRNLLTWADIISIHASGKGVIIGKKELKSMKKGAFLVNVARGGLVDEKALYDSLKMEHLAGAALDVFEKEPYTGHLKELDNVVLTPHIGSYAKETRVRMEIEAVNNLLKGLKG
jgi:D-3-phosphoglycerate dehydrogenase / 2-oxoglutarate reductase